jgi:hypothetical protein
MFEYTISPKLTMPRAREKSFNIPHQFSLATTLIPETATMLFLFFFKCLFHFSSIIGGVEEDKDQFSLLHFKCF